MKFALSLCGVVGLFAGAAMAAADPEPTGTAIPNPILFVTQFPISGDFAGIGSTFANHISDVESVGRGGDLWIRYSDGTLRNLTAEAGYGVSGFQGATSISVRDPAVNWAGNKAVFSMVIGATTAQYQRTVEYWQLYEITGFGVGQTVSIVKVPNQPLDYNNVYPTYDSDGNIIFATDRPRNGQRHLYPQHDEYESTTSVSGLWKLNPTTGALKLLEHSPSGSFDPFVDSYGRVVFTRWDHLQHDQQADNAGNPYGNFNFLSEADDVGRIDNTDEVFPEPRQTIGTINGHTLNFFFPWTINQNGSGEETLNHIGRHELHSYFNRSFNNDANLSDFNGVGRFNPNPIVNVLQLTEDPQQPGRYIGIDAPEFYTHASGQLIRINAQPSLNPDAMVVEYLTPRSTSSFYPETVPADFTGHYRNPIVLSNGTILVSHASEARSAGNDGTRENPLPRYNFRLKRLGASGAFQVPVADLTPGISKPITYFDPDYQVSYSGPLWELSPVEVRARSVPPSPGSSLPAPEQNAFVAENVDPSQFQDFLQRQGLGLIVMRNVTVRDDADRQQPFNLRVPNGTQTVANGGLLYDIAHMQFVQGDQLRGIGGIADPTPGRRVIGQFLHDGNAVRYNAPNPTGPSGSVGIASDGSVAAYVPGQRALAWQSTAPNGTPVVRERYWITLQPGEIRTCDSCHGVNQASQSGAGPSQQTPQALRDLLARWRTDIDALFADDFD